MIRRPPRSTHCISSAASDVYKRQLEYHTEAWIGTSSRASNIFASDKLCLLYTSPSPRDSTSS
eukprot:2374681-Prorocentrum_lima.AAC.1